MNNAAKLNSKSAVTNKKSKSGTRGEKSGSMNVDSAAVIKDLMAKYSRGAIG